MTKSILFVFLFNLLARLFKIRFSNFWYKEREKNTFIQVIEVLERTWSHERKKLKENNLSLCVELSSQNYFQTGKFNYKFALINLSFLGGKSSIKENKKLKKQIKLFKFIFSAEGLL